MVSVMIIGCTGMFVLCMMYQHPPNRKETKFRLVDVAEVDVNQSSVRGGVTHLFIAGHHFPPA